MTRTIAVVIFPNFQILDATGPISALEIASRRTQGGYGIALLSAEGGEVASSSGVRLVTGPLDERPYDTILVAGAGHDSVNCGPGDDHVVIHRGDHETNCEKVSRRG